MIDALRLLIADDERLARDLVRRYVERQPDLQLVAECADGDELARDLPAARADVALLDIVMPGRDVFDVLASLPPRAMPLVIFTTAFDRYAVRAFEVNAVDYILKPITDERLGAALERARERKPGDENLARLIRDLGPRPDRILVPHRDRMVPVAVADIQWIKAEGDYARIHVADGRNFLVTRTLRDLERRLDPRVFIRIHRSAIIRSDKIREVKGEGSSRLRVVLEDGTELIVSRGRAAALRRWMV
jgi:two-component system, LytTR family, response regulator